MPHQKQTVYVYHTLRLTSVKVESIKETGRNYGITYSVVHKELNKPLEKKTVKWSKNYNEYVLFYTEAQASMCGFTSGAEKPKSETFWQRFINHIKKVFLR